jgi:hypothetical protein
MLRAFRRVPQGYTPQLMALVGQPAAMMVPPAGHGYPWHMPPWMYGNVPWGGSPGGGGGGTPPPGACPPFNGPNCSPCPPSPEAARYEQLAYEQACAQNQAIMMQAMKVDAISRLPTKGLAANSALVTAGGVTTRNVAAFTEQTILVSPSVPACIIDWTISAVSTNFFEIRRLDTAMTKYIGADGPMPADSFRGDGTHPTMDWPTITPGMNIELVVANVTAEPHEFRSTFHFIRGADPGSCLR